MKFHVIVFLFMVCSVMAQAQMAQSSNAETCFDGSAVKVNSAMNIREEPTTSSDKTGATERGTAFLVTESQQGRTYCWLQIEPGWMAQTGIVVPLEEPYADGSSTHQALVRNALGLLRREAPDSYLFVLQHIDVVAMDCPEQVYSWVCTENPQAFLDLKYSGRTSERIIRIPAHYEFNVNARERTLLFAQTMVHEACHFEQLENESVAFLRDPSRREPPCMKMALAMVQQVNPRSELVALIRRAIRRIGVNYTS